MAKANDNVRYVSKKDVKGKNVTKKVYKVDPTKPHQQRSSGNYVSSNNSAQDYYFHQARRNPHQYLVNYKPVKTGREYYAEQARKNPHEYLTNYEIQPYQSREEWMTENRNQHKEKRGLLDRLFGTMYYNGIIEGLYNATDNDDSTTFGQGLVEGAKYMNPFENDVSGRITTSDVLRNLGWEDREDGKPNIARGVVGFIGDVLLDPMTYLNPFSSAGKIAKGTGITLDAAKELKALSKAASISDDLAKAEKIGTASGKLRDLPMNDVVNYVKERKPHLNDEQIQVEAERLHSAYARKVYGLRNADEGADFGVGWSGIPFSSKIKVGDKTLDKFQKSFVKASTLRELGDKTIAPYYNSLMKKLRTTRMASSVSKSNSMLRTASKGGNTGIFDSFKEFYLSDLMKGYGKAAKNIEDINTADKLKELFEGATDEDYLHWIKDHEDGIHEAKIKFDEVRLKADEEYLQKVEMNEAEKKKVLEAINTQKKQLQQLKEDTDELYSYLTAEDNVWEYRYANNTLESVRNQFETKFENWWKAKQLGEQIPEAEKLMNEATKTVEDSTVGLRNKIDELQTKVDANAEKTTGKFEDTLGPEELEKYQNRNSAVDDATSNYNSIFEQQNLVDEQGRTFADLIEERNALEIERQELVDKGFEALGDYQPSERTAPYSISEGELIDAGTFTFLNPSETNQEAKTWLEKYLSLPYYLKREAASEEAIRLGLPQTDWADKFSRYRKNKAGERTKEIPMKAASGVTGYDGKTQIEIAAKRPLIDTLNEIMPDAQFSVYGMNDGLFDDIFTDLVSGDYEKFFSNVNKYITRRDEILKTVPQKTIDDYFEKLERRYSMGQLGPNKNINEYVYNQLKNDPLAFMEDDEIRNIVNGMDRKNTVREKLYDKKDAELRNEKQTIEKYGVTNKERQLYEQIYNENRDLINKFGRECYELFGKAPGSMTAKELREFCDEMYLLQGHSKPTWHKTNPYSGEEAVLFTNKTRPTVSKKNDMENMVQRVDKINWLSIKHSFDKNFKGRKYTRIRKDLLDILSSGNKDDAKMRSIMKNYGEYISFEEASDLVSKRISAADMADVISAKQTTDFDVLRDSMDRQDYSVERFKRNFINMSHEDRMDVLRNYNSDVYDEVGNYLSDVWDETINKLKESGFTWTSSLDGLTDYEKDIAYRFFKKSWSKDIQNFPEDKIGKLNEVAQRIVRENALDATKTTSPNKVEDAVNSLSSDIEAIKKHYNLDNDADWERLLDDRAETKFMTAYDRELDFCDLLDSTSQYNDLLFDSHPANKLIAGYDDLVDINKAIKLETDSYREMLFSVSQGNKVSKKQLRLQKRELARLLNVRENIVNAMKDAGTPLRVEPKSAALLKAKKTESEETQRLLSRRINLFDDLKNLSDDDIEELSRFRSLGSEEVDDIHAVRDKENEYMNSISERLEYINEKEAEIDASIENMKANTVGIEYIDEDAVRLAKLRKEDAIAYKQEIEAKKAEYKRQQKNARQNTKRWLAKIKKFTEELRTAEKFSDAYVEQYRELVKEGASIPYVSQEDLSYLGNRMRQLTDYIREYDSKMEKYSKLSESAAGLRDEISKAKEDLGALTYADIQSTTNAEISDMLGFNWRMLDRIAEMNRSDWEIEAHKIFADRMEQIASDEAKNNLLSRIQGESHIGGRTYVRHELSEKGKEMVGISNPEARESVFNPEWGSRAKYNKRRHFNTIEEGINVMGDDFYILDPVELFLTRAIKSNELIHSNEVNNVIKDMCEPFTGVKTSDHVVANYIDVNNALYAGWKEAAIEAETHGTKYTKTFDEFKKEALKEAGIDEKMFSENYAYFDVLPEQMDMLNRKFGKKSKALMYNMDNKLYHTVNQFTELQMNSMKSGFTKAFDGVQRGWKAVNTFINPGFHIQNALSNAFSSMLAIGADAYNVKKINKTLNILRTKDPKQIIKLGGKDYTFKQVADLIEQYGVIDNTFFNKDVMDSLEGVYNFFPFKLGNKVGTTVEGTQRAHLFISALDQGMSPAEAAEMVDKFLFDYADLTHFEQAHLKRIIPFYTFMRKNLPLQFEMMIEKPQVYSNFQKAFREIGQMGEDGEYVEENERNPWRQGDIQLPFKINGRSYGIADQLPYTQLERILDPQKLIGQTSPWLKTPVEMLTNTFLYTGQPIFGGDEESIGANLLNYAAQQAPYAKMFQNSNKSGKDMEGVTAEEDAATRKKLYILGQLLGFPVNSIDRMYWYDDYGNWAADMFDTPLPQQIRNNMKLRK